ncbi:MAG: molybdate ABC transporter substrate-binding protein [Ramlibacter sp.]
MTPFIRLLLTLALLGAVTGLRAETVQVAVAANFTAPMNAIAASFARDTGHQARLAFGSTGKLYAQIRNGAPFEVFLAADQETPARLEKDAAAVASSRFTYATGQLVLWSPRAGVVDSQGEVLRRNEFQHLAIAAPKLAPYGAAAVETLTRLGLMQRVAPKLVLGESIGQAFSFVASGNAQLGLVALSQVYEDGRIKTGSGWVVPARWHEPLRQDAVQLVRGQANPAAAALMDYLKTDKARAIIRAHGYGD